jgi:hypothetical protein
LETGEEAAAAVERRRRRAAASEEEPRRPQKDGCSRHQWNLQVDDHVVAAAAERN